MVAQTNEDRTIESLRLRIRAAREADAHALAALMNARISARLSTWPEELTPEMATQRLADDLAQPDRIAPMVLELREGAEVCGWLSVIRRADDPGCGMLSYWLGEAHQGRGLMREAVPLVVRHAFNTMGLDRLRGGAHADNHASIAVLRAVGMQPLGLGSVWCSVRGREEACLWFEMDRSMALGAAAWIGHSEDAGDSAGRAGVPER